jgi:hypothetical protein
MLVLRCQLAESTIGRVLRLTSGRCRGMEVGHCVGGIILTEITGVGSSAGRLLSGGREVLLRIELSGEML